MDGDSGLTSVKKQMGWCQSTQGYQGFLELSTPTGNNPTCPALTPLSQGWNKPNTSPSYVIPFFHQQTVLMTCSKLFVLAPAEKDLWWYMARLVWRLRKLWHLEGLPSPASWFSGTGPHASRSKTVTMCRITTISLWFVWDGGPRLQTTRALLLGIGAGDSVDVGGTTRLSRLSSWSASC